MTGDFKAFGLFDGVRLDFSGRPTTNMNVLDVFAGSAAFRPAEPEEVWGRKGF
jgi:hypothetical protein